MAIRLARTANLGSGKSGKVGSVGYTIYNSDGTEIQSRTTSGVYELATSSGLYGVNISVTNAFSGSIVWDVESVYAVEEVSTNDQFNRQMTEGRWKIDPNTDQMIFYMVDNTTEIARYDLKDESGSASYSSVFDRVKA
jgi:hypothetical protein